MTRRVFLYVCKAMGGGAEFMLYFDDPPRPTMLRSPPIYARELTGTRWATMPLSDIVAEYRRRVAAKTLPPSNMVPTPPRKRQDKIKRARPERPWRVGDLKR